LIGGIIEWMGEVNSTQKASEIISSSVGKRSRKKEKQEDPSDIVIYDASTSSTSEDESGGERGRRKRIDKSSRKKVNGVSNGWHHEFLTEQVDPTPEDLKKLAVDEKNLEWDETYRAFHGILYGRDYKKEDEEKLARTQGKKNIGVEILETGNDYLIHKITGKETMEGLALKYGVQASHIKKVNRLWKNDELFARKEIIIPTSIDTFLNHQTTNATQRSGKEVRTSLDYSSINKKELINKFVEIAACEPEEALYYLGEKNWDFTQALGYYFSNGSDGSDVETKRKSFDGSQRRALKEEIEEIWEEPTTKNQKEKGPPLEDMRNHLPASYLTNPLVPHAQKRLQERFAKQDQELFQI